MLTAASACTIEDCVDFICASACLTVTSAFSSSTLLISCRAASSLRARQLGLGVGDARPSAARGWRSALVRFAFAVSTCVSRMDGIEPRDDLALLHDRVEVGVELLDDAGDLRADRDGR